MDEFSYIGVDNLLQDKKGKTVLSYVPEVGSVNLTWCLNKVLIVIDDNDLIPY